MTDLPINQIIQGDCLEVMRGWPDKCVDLIVTSPPYNARMEYEDELPWPRYFDFLGQFARQARRVLVEGGVLAVNLPKEIKHTKDQIDSLGSRVTRIAERFNAICTDKVKLLPRECIIWAKGSVEGEPYSHISATGSDNNIYIRSTCEIITLHSRGRYFYDGGTGRRGKEAVPFTDETKDIWWLRPVSSNGHPCPFPAEIPGRLIKMFTCTHKRKPVVCDPFAGSGTTLLMAKQLGRDFVGVEKEPKYVAICKERLKQEQLPL